MHNESNPSGAFLTAANTAAHEEYPGDQMFTCGEEENNYLDVYVSSSQHGVRNYTGSRACIISEYGDWEHGCVWSATGPITGCKMRLDRSASESALNSMRSTRENDLKLNEGCSWFTADGIWSVFDYQSWDKMPYTTCGDIDIFRIPKYSSYVTGNQIPLIGELSASSSDINVVIDTAGLNFMADGSDIAIVYAANVSDDVTFSVAGPGAIVGKNPAEAIAGIATVLLRAGTDSGTITVSAKSGSLTGSASVTSHTSYTKGATGNRKEEQQPLTNVKMSWKGLTVLRKGSALTIRLPEDAVSEAIPVTFTLYNGMGRIVGEWKLKTADSVIENRTYAKGIYIGKVSSGTQQLVNRVLW